MGHHDNRGLKISGLQNMWMVNIICPLILGVAQKLRGQDEGGIGGSKMSYFVHV